jgi:hypothetical protein
MSRRCSFSICRCFRGGRARGEGRGARGALVLAVLVAQVAVDEVEDPKGRLVVERKGPRAEKLSVTTASNRSATIAATRPGRSASSSRTRARMPTNAHAECASRGRGPPGNPGHRLDVVRRDSGERPASELSLDHAPQPGMRQLRRRGLEPRGVQGRVHPRRMTVPCPRACDGEDRCFLERGREGGYPRRSRRRNICPDSKKRVPYSHDVRAVSSYSQPKVRPNLAAMSTPSHDASFRAARRAARRRHLRRPPDPDGAEPALANLSLTSLQAYGVAVVDVEPRPACSRSGVQDEGGYVPLRPDAPARRPLEVVPDAGVAAGGRSGDDPRHMREPA